MKTFKFLLLAAITTLTFSCSSDDDIAPIVEEEVITTLQVRLTGGGEIINLEFKDLDPDGPTPPTITVSGPLKENTTYLAEMTLLNELVSPAENITEEIETEAEEHQFFYLPTSGLSISNLTYLDFDNDGNPLGLRFSFETGTASQGSLTIILRHDLNKNGSGVSDGNITNAGGDTDISAEFPLVIQ